MLDRTCRYGVSSCVSLPPILIVQEFFDYPDMVDLLPGLCVFHINATGQEDGARKLLDDFQYPTMEEMAEQVSRKFQESISPTFLSPKPSSFFADNFQHFYCNSSRQNWSKNFGLSTKNCIQKNAVKFQHKWW